MANNMKNFCNKVTEVAKKMSEKTMHSVKDASNKFIDYMTPKKDYSNFSKEDAEALRKFDRAMTTETIIDCCWWVFYIIFCAAMIAISIKQQSNIYDELIEEE